MWGPEPIGSRIETYQEAPGGERYVEYYDKARMEVTNPNGDPNSIWYVTNGLLVSEMIAGLIQVADDDFVERDPAYINVAGDSDDPFGITYSMLGDRLADYPLPVGYDVIEFLDVDGTVSVEASYAGYGVIGAHLDPVTEHTIASPFWDFMNSSGTIYANGSYTTGSLFPDPLFATGRPLTEAYWAVVKVGGTYTDVLLQCFERRCLTYTPTNPPEWQVEAGNVGLHYREWRYEQASPDDVPDVGELLYYSPLTDWNTGSYGEDGEIFVENDTYHMYTYADGFLYQYLDTGNSPFTDTWVDLDLRLVSEQNPDAVACLMARLDTIDVLSYSYDFCLTADGWTFAVYEQFNPEALDVLLPLEQRSGATDPNQWTTLSIITRGEALWFLINDEVVGTVSHTGPPGGSVGFYVSNPGPTPVEFEFSDLYVWEVE